MKIKHFGNVRLRRGNVRLRRGNVRLRRGNVDRSIGFRNQTEPK